MGQDRAPALAGALELEHSHNLGPLAGILVLGRATGAGWVGSGELLLVRWAYDPDSSLASLTIECSPARTYDLSWTQPGVHSAVDV